MAKSKNVKRKYGVRVFKMDKYTLLIKQTVKSGSGTTDEYIIDGQKERYVEINDDSGIADAVRDGVTGQLKAGKG